MPGQPGQLPGQSAAETGQFNTGKATTDEDQSPTRPRDTLKSGRARGTPDNIEPGTATTRHLEAEPPHPPQVSPTSASAGRTNIWSYPPGELHTLTPTEATTRSGHQHPITPEDRVDYITPDTGYARRELGPALRELSKLKAETPSTPATRGLPQ